MQPVEKESCKHAIALGWEAVKLYSQQQIGLPDRMFVGPDRKLFFCEFKRPGEQLSPSQRRKIRRWGLLGWTIHVIDELKIFKDIIKEYNK